MVKIERFVFPEVCIFRMAEGALLALRSSLIEDGGTPIVSFFDTNRGRNFDVEFVTLDSPDYLNWKDSLGRECSLEAMTLKGFQENFEETTGKKFRSLKALLEFYKGFTGW